MPSDTKTTTNVSAVTDKTSPVKESILRNVRIKVSTVYNALTESKAVKKLENRQMSNLILISYDITKKNKEVISNYQHPLEFIIGQLDLLFSTDPTCFDSLEITPKINVDNIDVRFMFDKFNNENDLTDEDFEELISLGFFNPESYTDEEITKLVHCVANYACFNVMDFLINKGVAVINRKDNLGRTTLMEAVTAHALLKNKKLVEDRNRFVVKLLKMGANANERTKSGISAFQLAMAHSHISVAASLIEYGLNVNAPCTTNGMTPLQYASSRGSDEIAALLIEAGADGRNALSLAVQSGNISCVELVVEHCLDIDKKCTADGMTPLLYALSKGYVEIAALLIEKKADINRKTELHRNALSLAISSKNIACVKLVIEHGLNVNEKCTANGMTPLHEALSIGSDEIAALLIEKKADINKKTENGRNALSLAIRSKNIACVKLVIKHGLNVNEKCTANGITPLLEALSICFDEIAALLIEEGADINRKTEDGRNALSLAIDPGNISCVKLVIEHGLNVNEKCTADGMTPLMCAVEFVSYGFVRFLIGEGADVNRIENCSSAFSIALSSNESGMAQLLIEHGLNINDPCTADGMTPLMCAVKYNNIKIVELLMDKGADVNSINQINGMSVIDYAKGDRILSLLKSGDAVPIKSKEQDTLKPRKLWVGEPDKTENNPIETKKGKREVAPVVGSAYSTVCGLSYQYSGLTCPSGERALLPKDYMFGLSDFISLAKNNPNLIPEELHEIQQTVTLPEDIQARDGNPDQAMVTSTTTILKNAISIQGQKDKLESSINHAIGLNLLKINGDGDCLFSCFAEILRKTLPGMNSDILRKNVSHFIKFKAEEYREQIIGSQEGMTVEKYAYEISIPRGKWGGEIEIRILSSLFEIPVIVFNNGVLLKNGHSMYGVNDYPGKEPVLLSYNGATHYDLYTHDNPIKFINELREKHPDVFEQSKTRLTI